MFFQKKSAQITAKKIVKKHRNLARKKHIKDHHLTL